MLQNMCLITFNLFVALFVLMLTCSAAPTGDKSNEFVTFTTDAERKCFGNTINYLSQFNTLSKWNYVNGKPTEAMINSLQEHIGLPVTGKLDEKTCSFMSRRWEHKIITWRLKNNDEAIKKVIADSFAKWSTKIDLVFLDVDSKYAEIQISFDEKPEKCNGIELKALLDYANDANEMTESFACVYPPGSGIGGDILIYNHNKWVDNRSETEIEGNNFKLPTGALYMIAYALGLSGDAGTALDLFKHQDFTVIDIAEIQNKYGKP